MSDEITKAKLLEVFGTQAAIAEALGIKPQAVQQWKDDAVPPLRQYQLREMYPDLWGNDSKAA